MDLGYKENDIVISNKDIEKYTRQIWYNDPIDKKRKYYPDIYIVSENKIIEKKVFRFEKPTLSELKTYMLEIGMADVSEKWFDYYESNGWLVGKNKMKNWKAAVRTWKNNNLSNNVTTPQVINRKVFNLREYDERT